MEEIPKLPEITEDFPDNDVQRAAEWFINQESVYPAVEPLQYELNISPAARAARELHSKPEAEFDRRREVLDESTPKVPVESRMEAVGNILAKQPATKRYQQLPLEKTDSKPRLKRAEVFSAQPVYRKSLTSGLLAGLIAASMTIAFIILTGR